MERFVTDAFGFQWINDGWVPQKWDDSLEMDDWLRKSRASATSYLDALQGTFPWARLLRMYGTHMEQSYFTADINVMKPGYCYWNAICMRRQVLLQGSRQYGYAEGLFLPGGPPMLHGWNMLGKYVFDGTLGPNPHARYFGMAFSDAFLQFLAFVLPASQWQPGAGVFEAAAHTGPYIQNYARSRYAS